MRQIIHRKVNSDTILFFDMDGTLIDTNFANYLSYKKAIETVKLTTIDILYNPNERFNRSLLKKTIPNLSEPDYETIIKMKEELYKEYLPHTKLNKLIADILVKYSKTNKTVLVTNCREDRALITLNYHGIFNQFSNYYFRQLSATNNKINKFKNAIVDLKISPDLVIVFENEENEIKDAINAGIHYDNIIIL